MSRISTFLMRTGLALATVAGLMGCGVTDAYRYESIKSDYAHLACSLEAAHQADDASADTCAVNSQLSLDQVLAIARSNNPDLMMAAARIERARALLKQSAAPFLPKLGVYTEYMQGDAPSAYLFKTIDQRRLPPGTDFNDPGWFENFESGVTAGVNLFSGGQHLLQRQMAQAGLEISRLDRDAIENQVVATAIGAYYDVLAAANFTTVAQESVATTADQLRIMRVRFQSGGALKTDLLSLEVRLAESEEILVQTRNRRRLAQAGLAELLGVTPEVPFGLLPATGQAIPVPDDPVAALEVALAHRPELARVRQQLRQSKMAVDAATADYLPRIDFSTRYYADDPEMRYSRDRENWTAAVLLNWNLFDGFATRNRRAEALSRLQESLAADRKTLLAVKFDVKKAYLNLDEASERLKVARAIVTTARETHRLIKRQYEGGSADITRYLEAELAYNRARMRETTAYFDREKARAQIARAIGQWTPQQNLTSQEE